MPVNYPPRSVIVTFAYPSSLARAGGVTMMYEFANAMARRGHDVHFAHGPALPDRITSLEQLTFHFDPRVRHHIVDSFDDPSLPDGDVVFTTAPARLGQPVVLVQGFRLLGPDWDRATFRAPAPKVCIASWLVEVGRSFGVPGEQLEYVPMGLDHELFVPRTPLAKRRFDLAVLYHPLREKGWDVAYDAIRELARRRPALKAVVFSMAGPPPEILPDGVDIILGLDQQRLAEEVYDSTRLLMQTSYHEGFGLTAVEAMACGAALVTTDCGGSRDYAVPDETAYVVPSGDSAGLADRADMLLSDEDRLSAVADSGARFVRRFTWDRSAEMLEAFLERYLADPSRYQAAPGVDRSEEYEL